MKKQGIDLISNLGESLEEELTGAKKGFFYQMAACDINGDGEKEIIIAGGNKMDVLELRVLQVKKNYDPVHHGYYRLGERVGNAFKDGEQLK